MEDVNSGVVIDKHGVLRRLDTADEIILELGCGRKKKFSHSIGIDLLDYPEVDIIGDVYEVLSRFPEGSVTHVYASHFIEHVDDLARLIREFERILGVRGTITLVAPHFSSPYFYSDPTHRSFFGLYTFCYFCDSNIFLREVP